MILSGCAITHGPRVVLNAFAPLPLVSYDYDLLHMSCGQALQGYTILNSGARRVFVHIHFKPVLLLCRALFGH